ncbi:hypothetical protein WT55_02085 [Burkholderia pseudomultivorans]|nr:hypothetical protein WT55_02085 [Burkholderia pseudomultivorans]
MSPDSDAGCMTWRAGRSVPGPSELYEQCQELRSYVRESEGWDEEMEAQALAIRDTLEGMVSALQH